MQVKNGERIVQADHLSEKPGNVRNFDSWQGNVRDFTKSEGNVREQVLLWKVAKDCLLFVAYLCPYQYLVASSG